MEFAGKSVRVMNLNNQNSITKEIRTEFKYPWISITSFGIMMLSFFFTFCVFTCAGERISEKTYSGIDIMTMRMSEEVNYDFGMANIITWLAFISAMAGLILSFLRKKPILIAMTGFTGVFFLMLLYAYIKYQVKQSSDAMASWMVVKFKFGYFLAIFSGLYGSLWNLRKHLEIKKPPISGGV